MPNLNKVMLMGNLTRDPELKFTPKGTAVADFGIAINEKWKDSNGTEKEETLFADITFFGRVAEVIAEHFKKGRPIYIEGKLKLDSWEDKATGQQRSKMKIIGDNFQFLSSGTKEDRPPAKQERREPAQESASMEGVAASDGDDDIPF